MTNIAPGRIFLVPEPWLFHCSLEDLAAEINAMGVEESRAFEAKDGQRLFNAKCLLRAYEFAYGVVLRATSQN